MPKSPQSRSTEQRDAAEAIDSRTRRRSMSTTQFQRLRDLLLSDSYLFTRTICGHRDLIDSAHMPLSYMACGLTDRLIETFDMFDSYVVRSLRAELMRREIAWWTAEGRAKLDTLLDFQNHRWSRHFFKSSVITHGAPTFMATRDPNLTIKITHAVDDKAWAFCAQIGETILSGRYRDFFPERIPQGQLTKLITMREITLGGRTISHPQTTIQASGYNTGDEGAHYDTFFDDDLVNEQNSTVAGLKAVHRYLRGLPGYYMPTRRIRRREVGTKHDEDDDDAFLTSKNLALECLTLRVPIEEDTPDSAKSILMRGRPTIPEMYPAERITRLQRHVLTDETEPDGVRSWLNNFKLVSRSSGARLFPPSLVDDPDHWWLGPFVHDRAAQHKMGRYLVARYRRDEEGRPIAKKGQTIFDADGNLIEECRCGKPAETHTWRDHASVIAYCPWADLDRVALVDPAWVDRDDPTRASYKDPDNWAVSAVATDPDMVAFQLETLSDTTGIEGWIDALAELDEFFHFRVIGFDGTAMQDPVIQNLMKTDPRLKPLRSRMRKVPRALTSKTSHMRAGLAEPMAIYQFLLRPDEDGNETRTELKAIRGAKSDRDGIADSLAMHRALNKASRTEKQRDEDEADVQPRPKVDPILGVPVAA